MTQPQDPHPIPTGRRDTTWGRRLLAAGAAFAAAAIYVNYKARKTERENPPHGKFVDVDGMRLHYVERGSGQPLVLLHGNGTMSTDFELSDVFARASEKYRVIAFDRPGFGYSERPDDVIWSPEAQAHVLHQALEKLEVEQPVVVGHSWATLVALAMGLQRPTALRSLVLLSGYYFPTARVDAPIAATATLPVVGAVMRHTVSPLVGRALWPATLRAMFGPPPVPQQFERFPVWMAMRPSQIQAAAMEGRIMIQSAAHLQSKYRQLTVPVTIMAGTDDRIVDPEYHSRRLHRELPQSALELVSGVGHMIQHEAPDRILAAIDRRAARDDTATTVAL